MDLGELLEETMTHREALIKAIEDLKRDKPHKWLIKCKRLVRELEFLDDPYREHEWHGSEQLGRHAKLNRGPRYDRMGDNSFP